MGFCGILLTGKVQSVLWWADYATMYNTIERYFFSISSLFQRFSLEVAMKTTIDQKIANISQ